MVCSRQKRSAAAPRGRKSGRGRSRPACACARADERVTVCFNSPCAAWRSARRARRRRPCLPSSPLAGGGGRAAVPPQEGEGERPAAAAAAVPRGAGRGLVDESRGAGVTGERPGLAINVVWSALVRAPVRAGGRLLKEEARSGGAADGGPPVRAATAAPSGRSGADTQGTTAQHRPRPTDTASCTVDTHATSAHTLAPTVRPQYPARTAPSSSARGERARDQQAPVSRTHARAQHRRPQQPAKMPAVSAEY